MNTFMQKLVPFFLVLFAISFIEAGIIAEYADARSRMGGRMFKRTMPRKQAVPKAQQRTNQGVNKGTQANRQGFSRGLMGGLLGGAIGAFLFGALFGAGGTGVGILPLLILGLVAFFLFRKSRRQPVSGSSPGFRPPPTGEGQSPFGAGFPGGMDSVDIPPKPQSPVHSLEAGFAEIRATDPGFDENYFIEVASDVFFQVQAGWMRRDLSSYEHLLGKQLAAEYELHFEEMRRKGHINKLESIAIRDVQIVDAGSDGSEDYITIHYTASLLDYTVDDSSGELVDGSMTEPVKFSESWTWARPVNTEDWKLEGIEAGEE